MVTNQFVAHACTFTRRNASRGDFLAPKEGLVEGNFLVSELVASVMEEKVQKISDAECRGVVLCPGFIKAGTSSLFNLLSVQPLFAPYRNKETHFFSYMQDEADSLHPDLRPTVLSKVATDLAEYQKLFSAERTQYLLDVSPSYLAHPDALSRAADALSNPFIIITTRDPLARAISAWSHAVRVGLETRPFIKALIQSTSTDLREIPLRQYFSQSDYRAHIESCERIFGPDRILVCTTEAIDNPQVLLAAIRARFEIPTDLSCLPNEDSSRLLKNGTLYASHDQFFLNFLLRRRRLTNIFSRLLRRFPHSRIRLQKMLFKPGRPDIPSDDLQIASGILSEQSEYFKSL